MRVLHLGKFFPPYRGGMENFLGDLLPALAAHGVDVGALVHDHSFITSGPPDNPGNTYGTSNIWRVPCHGQLLYTPVSPSFPYWLKRIIQRFKPDILHCHLPNPSAFWTMFLPSARRLPLILHWHSDVVASKIDRRLSLAYRLYRPFEQKLLARAGAVLVSTPPYLAESPPLARWRDKCEIIPLGLDPGRLPLPADDQRQWGLGLWRDARFRILAVGRLTYYKGHDVLIRAAANLHGARVIIAGKGEGRDRLAKLVSLLKLHETVNLSGALSDPELHALYATCDCLCLPSIERTEAFGMVLLEAMRYSKPVIAGNIHGSGVGWVIKDKTTGLLVPPGDHEALAQAIRLLMDDKGLGRKMGAAGEDRFNSLFHIDGVASEIKAVYDQMLG